ncbi:MULTISPECIES: hypothetical protein [unclassified Halomonas]|uniref:hypothetical protein n=1 Tax=unclassified Halomonas TaxID=2609666 RepID=UPI00246940AC|nr:MULTISPECIES: hypothetical protein [unclassified Halomonas]
MSAIAPSLTTLRELLHEILPKLKASERLLGNTLHAIIEAAEDPRERARRREQKDALELELFTIRLNVESLLKRHAQAVRDAERQEGEGEDAVLSLDANEAAAIEKARDFHEKVQALQQGRSVWQE